jgi:hypothetical protein
LRNGEEEKARRERRQKIEEVIYSSMAKANNLISKGSFVFLVSRAPSTRRKFGETNKKCFSAGSSPQWRNCVEM